MIEQWLTLPEICEHLKLSKETVYRMIYAKKIPFQKIGKVYRFKASIVDAYLSKNIKEQGKSRSCST